MKIDRLCEEELQMLAEGNEPFNFTMLTADTHFTDGYLCPRCEQRYEEQYSNVIACSSRMIAEFVSWILQQDFYENDDYNSRRPSDDGFGVYRTPQCTKF